MGIVGLVAKLVWKFWKGGAPCHIMGMFAVSLMCGVVLVCLCVCVCINAKHLVTAQRTLEG